MLKENFRPNPNSTPILGDAVPNSTPFVFNPMCWADKEVMLPTKRSTHSIFFILVLEFMALALI